MTSQEKLKGILAALVIVGVFALSGMAVYMHELSVKAAIAMALASLSSAAGLIGLLPKKEED